MNPPTENQTQRAFVCVVCGKGGVGKTAFMTLASAGVRELFPEARLLLIDADPAFGLAYALGVAVDHRTVGGIRSEIIEAAQGGEKEKTSELVQTLDAALLEAVHERDGYSLLAMGRSESLGCFCSVNSLLRKAIDLLIADFDIILVDAEAGLEQLNRQVVNRIDTLLVLSDGSYRSIETAAQIFHMAALDVVQCKRLGLVFNRVVGSGKALKDLAESRDLNVFGLVPEDPLLGALDRMGRPLLELASDAPSRAAARKIVQFVFDRVS